MSKEIARQLLPQDGIFNNSDPHTSSFIPPYTSRDFNKDPDLFYRYDEYAVEVRHRNSLQSEVKSQLKSDCLSSMIGKEITIAFVLDCVYMRQPVIIIIAVDGTANLYYVFWHDVFSNETKIVNLVENLEGSVTKATVTRWPITLVEESRQEILNEENLRHMLVMSKSDGSTIITLLEYTDRNIQTMMSSIPHDISDGSSISALYIIPQNSIDIRKGFSDPRILIGTSTGITKIYRLRALLSPIMEIIQGKDLTCFVKNQNAPITYLSGTRLSESNTIVVAIGQNTVDSDEASKTCISLVQLHNNGRQRHVVLEPSGTIQPCKILTTRVIPARAKYQVVAIFQTLCEGHRFELKCWSVTESTAKELLTYNITEENLGNTQDVWPMNDAMGYFLLRPQQLIEMYKDRLPDLTEGEETRMAEHVVDSDLSTSIDVNDSELWKSNENQISASEDILCEVDECILEDVEQNPVAPEEISYGTDTENGGIIYHSGDSEADDIIEGSDNVDMIDQNHNHDSRPIIDDNILQDAGKEASEPVKNLSSVNESDAKVDQTCKEVTFVSEESHSELQHVFIRSTNHNTKEEEDQRPTDSPAHSEVNHGEDELFGHFAVVEKEHSELLSVSNGDNTINNDDDTRHDTEQQSGQIAMTLPIHSEMKDSEDNVSSPIDIVKERSNEALPIETVDDSIYDGTDIHYDTKKESIHTVINPAVCNEVEDGENQACNQVGLMEEKSSELLASSGDSSNQGEFDHPMEEANRIYNLEKNDKDDGIAQYSPMLIDEDTDIGDDIQRHTDNDTSNVTVDGPTEKVATEATVVLDANAAIDTEDDKSDNSEASEHTFQDETIENVVSTLHNIVRNYEYKEPSGMEIYGRCFDKANIPDDFPMYVEEPLRDTERELDDVEVIEERSKHDYNSDNHQTATEELRSHDEYDHLNNSIGSIPSKDEDVRSVSASDEELFYDHNDEQSIDGDILGSSYSKDDIEETGYELAEEYASYDEQETPNDISPVKRAYEHTSASAENAYSDGKSWLSADNVDIKETCPASGEDTYYDHDSQTNNNIIYDEHYSNESIASHETSPNIICLSSEESDAISESGNFDEDDMEDDVASEYDVEDYEPLTELDASPSTIQADEYVIEGDVDRVYGTEISDATRESVMDTTSGREGCTVNAASMDEVLLGQSKENDDAAEAVTSDVSDQLKDVNLIKTTSSNINIDVYVSQKESMAVHGNDSLSNGSNMLNNINALEALALHDGQPGGTDEDHHEQMFEILDEKFDIDSRLDGNKQNVNDNDSRQTMTEQVDDVGTIRKPLSENSMNYLSTDETPPINDYNDAEEIRTIPFSEHNTNENMERLIFACSSLNQGKLQDAQSALDGLDIHALQMESVTRALPSSIDLSKVIELAKVVGSTRDSVHEVEQWMAFLSKLSPLDALTFSREVIEQSACPLGIEECLKILFYTCFEGKPTEKLAIVNPENTLAGSDRELELLSDLPFSESEFEALARYCWHSDDVASKLFFMNYCLKHGRLGEAILLNDLLQSGKHPTFTVDDEAVADCRILAATIKKDIDPRICEFPLEIYGRPRGLSYNPFLSRTAERKNFFGKHGLSAGVRLMCTALVGKKRSREDISLSSIDSKKKKW
ncbi:hypothetical protein EC973_003158 [Apophysomyces ossiformis]|uniref:Uncharacterized protein n=1 Tax=Apophysomyces ossiformis TaxID=679940 RepID=A0A8H7EMG5_9FUNG|nr:hypothetical protein EC973_003158 [Apophysomyces ossiformis]